MKPNGVDMNGTIIAPGDVMLEYGRGCMGSSTGTWYIYKLWEVPEVIDGHGYEYNLLGNKSRFAWASTRKSIKLDPTTLPEGFLYSFYHGMSDLNSRLESGSLHDVLEASDWKERQVQPDRVEKCLADITLGDKLEITKPKDLYINKEALLSMNSFPQKLVGQIIGVCYKQGPTMHNGELGLFEFQRQVAVQRVLQVLRATSEVFNVEK